MKFGQFMFIRKEKELQKKFTETATGKIGQ